MKFTTLIQALVLASLGALQLISAQEDAVLHSVVFVFATADANSTCEEISGRLHSLSRAALREAQFGLQGRWEAFWGGDDEVEEEDFLPDLVEEEYNKPVAALEEEGGVARRELQACQGSDCYIGCMNYHWWRFCACCSCCHGRWRRRRLNEPLSVRLGLNDDPEQLELKIAEIAIEMLEQWYIHNSKKLSCLAYPFKLAVDIDPAQHQDKWGAVGAKQDFWEKKWEGRKPSDDRLEEAAEKAERFREKRERKGWQRRDDEKAEKWARKKAKWGEKHGSDSDSDSDENAVAKRKGRGRFGGHD